MSICKRRFQKYTTAERCKITHLIKFIILTNILLDNNVAKSMINTKTTSSCFLGQRFIILKMGQLLCADGEILDEYKPCQSGRLKSLTTKKYPSLPTIAEEEYDEEHDVIYCNPIKISA